MFELIAILSKQGGLCEGPLKRIKFTEIFAIIHFTVAFFAKCNYSVPVRVCVYVCVSVWLCLSL